MPSWPLRRGFRTVALAAALLAALSLPAGAQERRPDNSLEVLRKAGMFQTFLSGVGDTELKARLSAPGSFTLFVPRDEAFAELDQETLEALRLPANRELLTRLILFHVVENEYNSRYEGKADLPSLSGDVIAYHKKGDRVTLNNGIRVLKSDIVTTNGVIHVIDKVIIPPEFKVALKPAADDKRS